MNKSKSLFPFKYKLSILFIIVVLGVSLVGGILQYFYSRNILIKDFNKNKQLILNNVINYVHDADYLYFSVENFLEPDINNILKSIKTKYEETNSINFNLHKYITNKPGYSIYIINKANRIIAATDDRDLGLNFTSNPEMVTLLNKVRTRGDILSDRISSSLRYSEIKKYSYLASSDKKYIFEIGVAIDNYIKDYENTGFSSLEKKLNNITEIVDSVILYSSNGSSYKKNVNKKPIRVKAENMAYFNSAIKSMKTVEVMKMNSSGRTLYQYIPYKIINNPSLNQINVIEIVYNYKSLHENIKQNVKIISLILILGIIISIIIGPLISRNISRPIDRITEGTKAISEGNFEILTNIKTNDEFEILSKNFDKMARDLLIREKEILEQNDEINALYEETAAMNDTLENLISDNNKSYLETVGSLVSAIEAKDSYTGGHSERVKQYSVKIAEVLGLSSRDISELEHGSLLHDIGKIGVPEEILNKTSRLDNAEYEMIKKHPLIGYDILRNLHFLSDSLKVVLEHHERFDGTGYPNGLKGLEISLLARIACVADSYDAMTTNRAYRKNPMTKEMAMEELVKNSGAQFDPEVVNAFIKWLTLN